MKMRNKFKAGEFVIVNGFGKKENKYYINEIGKVIERDDFFYDYHIVFENKESDWLDEKSLKKVKKYRERKIKI